VLGEGGLAWLTILDRDDQEEDEEERKKEKKRKKRDFCRAAACSSLLAETASDGHRTS
jgi:hypothetical protein